eukprot:TRINITY_DN20544_c0_g1_i1.p1 TRINITY_DN20544_c0_g1~~TRINITY_DN20544_c0_g1_i1.p1  ORF type:complete len:131 (-),score=9.05 TRINITY_DN20544_c0_g1_i1:8-400(-)
MADIVKHWQELESLCNGCRDQCDQKCVIDNHEVEIVQGPMFEMPAFTENSCCPSGRPLSVASLGSVGSDFSDLCSARDPRAINSRQPLRSRTVSGTGSAALLSLRGLSESERSSLMASPRVRRGMSMPGQ